MTWTLKHKRSDRPMIAEYLCPVHGRFALTVERNENGDPPDEARCPAPGQRERCAVCARPTTTDEDSLNLELNPDHGDGTADLCWRHWNIGNRCDGVTSEAPEPPCGRESHFAISAPGYCKVKNVEAVRGGYQKAERPTWTDTTNLGEGQDPDDWWDDRAKVWERQRESEIKELTNG